MRIHSSGRRGSVLIVVLVCLGFAATVLMGALRISLQQRRQLRNEHDSVQTEWLLDAGVRSAREALSKDSAYAGQKTTFEDGLRPGQVGVVEIQVHNKPNAEDVLTVQISARLDRPTSHFEIKRSLSFEFPLKKPGSQSLESRPETNP